MCGQEWRKRTGLTCQDRRFAADCILVVRLSCDFGLYHVTLGRAFGRTWYSLPDHLEGRRGFGFAALRRLRTCTLAKLSSLKPTLGSLPPAIGRLPGREAYERERRTVSWRNWYKLARWARLRMRVFERDLFTCQWTGCGRIEGDTSLLVADHRRPHRGDEALFWDETNIQTLCKPCHDGAKQRQERANPL